MSSTQREVRLLAVSSATIFFVLLATRHPHGYGYLEAALEAVAAGALLTWIVAELLDF